VKLPGGHHFDEVGGLRDGEIVLEVVRPVPLVYPWRSYPLLLLGGVVLAGGTRYLLNYNLAGEPGEVGAITVAILILSFGSLLIARVLMLIWRARTTVYVLTNQRFMEFFRWFGVRHIRSVAWSDVRPRRTTPLLGQTGDVGLHIRGVTGWELRKVRGILAIRDFRRLERIVHEQIEAARK
jgi:hypothetical protein